MLSLSMRALILCLSLLTARCNTPHATAKDCETIFGKIIDIELREQGFRDPVLAERKRQELQERFRTDLQACMGRPLPAHAMACVAAAQSTEEISHACFK